MKSFKINLLFLFLFFPLTLSFAQEEKKATWEQSFSLGLNLTEGNNDTFLFNTKYDASKSKDNSKIVFGLDANFGTENDKQSTNNYGGKGQYNKNISKKMYWLVSSSFKVDKIADLDYRFLIGPGLGRNLIKSKKTQFDIEAGLSYLREKFKTTTADDDIAVRAAQNMNHKLSDTAKVWQSLEYLGTIDDFDDYLLNAELGVETSMTKKVNLKSFIKNSFNNAPAPGKKKNDLSFVTMLTYLF